MVKSILDPTINYPETKNIDKEDKNYDSQVYEITLFSIEIRRPDTGCREVLKLWRAIHTNWFH